MSALFGPKADTWFRVGLALVLGGPVLVLTVLWLLVRSPLLTQEGAWVPQPIAFDHRHHVGDDRIDCRYCHASVETSSSAGYPSTDRCLGCHAQIWMESPALDLLRRSYFERRPIRWNRVTQLPEFVYFDHSIHVSKGVGCVTCHGRVDRMPLVARAHGMRMGWCLDCHRDPTPHLRPREAITLMAWRRAPTDPSGRELQRRYDVRARTDCTTCHR